MLKCLGTYTYARNIMFRGLSLLVWPLHHCKASSVETIAQGMFSIALLLESVGEAEIGDSIKHLFFDHA